MTRGLSLLTLTVLAACASSAPIRWASPAEFDLAVADNPAQQRFDLTLISKAAAPLCLSREAWPAEKAVPAGFDGATLTTASGKKELLPTGSAYCPGGCVEVRVEPGQAVRGALPYSAFGDAATIAADATRTLIFEVHPFVCSDR
ncbi:MAG TPA: hypothetical protein VD865_16115 [Stenotrophomonas sp.]|nr:hypothetical protein [Stenotrophomonas sp.]